VPVRVRCPVQQRRRLVEQCEIRLAPSASPRQPPDERLRRHTRKRSGDDAVEISAASERTLHVLERAVSGAAELLSVQAVHAPYELRAEALACRGDRIGSRYGVLDELRELVRIDAHLGAVKPHGDERFWDRRNRAHRLVEQRRHGQTALLGCEIARVSGCHRDIAAEDLRQRALVDALLAEHRKHVRDVLHEDRVRAGDEHPGAFELGPVGVEQPRGAVQPDRRLAGAGSALDHECAARLARDQSVLVALDRGDDVGHVLLAAALELFEQDVGDAARERRAGAVERLVDEIAQRPAFHPEAPAGRDSPRRERRRRVERPRGRRLPVDDERLVALVHPAPPDVERVPAGRMIDPPEAEPALRVLERAQPAGCPLLQHEHVRLADRRGCDGNELPPHLLEARVRMVNVPLL
jgi:hypothetical protein